MTVCFFGNYILDYPRVRVLRKGFLENNVKIVECHTRQRGFQKYLDLYGQHKKLKNKYNILLVMMGGQTLVWFAKMLTKKKIIFDAFASLYLTNIEDRKTCNRKSIKALYYKLLDKYSCKLADKVLLDTNAQINYFVENYKLNKNKFIRVFVSSDFSSCGYGFRFCHSRESGNPEKTDNTSKYSESCVRHDMAEKKERGIVGGKFIIHWHGYIVPFYSLETVIKTAKILEKNHPESLGIEFQIVTRFNSKYEKIKNLVNSVNLNNIKFYPETNYKEINNFINNSDICLGIFGNNKKAQVVIPNKIYEAIVCAKPVITANHSAIKELFTDKENILLVEPENEQDLADKILELKNNINFKNKIIDNCSKIYLDKLQPKQIIKKLLDQLE